MASFSGSGLPQNRQGASCIMRLAVSALKRAAMRLAGSIRPTSMPGDSFVGEALQGQFADGGPVRVFGEPVFFVLHGGLAVEVLEQDVVAVFLVVDNGFAQLWLDPVGVDAEQPAVEVFEIDKNGFAGLVIAGYLSCHHGNADRQNRIAF